MKIYVNVNESCEKKSLGGNIVQAVSNKYDSNQQFSEISLSWFCIRLSVMIRCSNYRPVPVNFLQFQPNIHKFWPIQKSQLFLGKQSQIPAIFKGQSQLPANGHQDPHVVVLAFVLSGLAYENLLKEKGNI